MPHVMSDHPITFSFGENWMDYLGSVRPESIEAAASDIAEWLGRDYVRGKTAVDIGCGSGIHSFCLHSMGARRLVSLDIDQASVDATIDFWRRAGEPGNWVVMRGSVLDEQFTRGLGKFDIVYAWGVLHHTGAMWDAVRAAADLVGPGGRLWMSLYTAGPNYETHLKLKQRYNASSRLGKKLMVWREIVRIMKHRRRQGKNPFTWNERCVRGMNVYHDLVDWLGGLPYEVAHPEEVVSRCAELGLAKVRVSVAGEGACSVYLFTRNA